MRRCQQAQTDLTTGRNTPIHDWPLCTPNTSPQVESHPLQNALLHQVRGCCFTHKEQGSPLYNPISRRTSTGLNYFLQMFRAATTGSQCNTTAQTMPLFLPESAFKSPGPLPTSSTNLLALQRSSKVKAQSLEHLEPNVNPSALAYSLRCFACFLPFLSFLVM